MFTLFIAQLTLIDDGFTIRDQADEERLLKLLFSEYNPAARPVINSSKTVPVILQFSLMHIKDLVSAASVSVIINMMQMKALMQFYPKKLLAFCPVFFSK